MEEENIKSTREEVFALIDILRDLHAKGATTISCAVVCRRLLRILTAAHNEKEKMRDEMLEMLNQTKIA